MAFEMIWNCRDNFENKDAKLCFLMAFEMIWNCRDHFEARTLLRPL